MSSTACFRLNEWLRDAQAMEQRAITMLNAVKPAVNPFRQHVPPDASCAKGAR